MWNVTGVIAWKMKEKFQPAHLVRSWDGERVLQLVTEARLPSENKMVGNWLLAACRGHISKEHLNTPLSLRCSSAGDGVKTKGSSLSSAVICSHFIIRRVITAVAHCSLHLRVLCIVSRSVDFKSFLPLSENIRFWCQWMLRLSECTLQNK